MTFDSLLWIIFMWHVNLTRIHAYITRGWFKQWVIRSERLTHLWFYYWSFQSPAIRQKSEKVIFKMTDEYKKDR